MSAARVRTGVVLAGGASRRFPGGKAGQLLEGKTLLARAVHAVRAAGLSPVVSARAATELPATGAERWDEPATAPQHPLSGIAYALERAGAPIVVLPVDLPLLPPAVLYALASAPAPGALVGLGGAPAALVMAVDPSLAPALHAAAQAGAPALRTLAGLGVPIIELATLAPGADPAALTNVNDPLALAQVARQLARGGATERAQP